MKIQFYPIKPLPKEPRRKDLLNWLLVSSLLVDNHTNIVNPTKNIPTHFIQWHPTALRPHQSVNWNNLLKIHVGISNSSHVTNLIRDKPTPKLPGFYAINARSLI